MRKKKIIDKKKAEDAAGNIGTSWITVETNRQMAQIPCPIINVKNGNSSSSILKFLADIAFWDGDWCAVGHGDRYNQYEFGNKKQQ